MDQATTDKIKRIMRQMGYDVHFESSIEDIENSFFNLHKKIDIKSDNFKTYSIINLPRQCGKSTLIRKMYNKLDNCCILLKNYDGNGIYVGIENIYWMHNIFHNKLRGKNFDYMFFDEVEFKSEIYHKVILENKCKYQFYVGTYTND